MSEGVDGTGNPMQPVDPTARPEPRYDAMNRLLCRARTRTGEQCNSPAMTGQRVCRMHGGATPQARNKARLRLAELVAPAIATLAREMASADKSTDRLRAANSILDRAGWGRVSTVETADAREVLLERLAQMRDEAQQMIDEADPADLADALTDEESKP